MVLGYCVYAWQEQATARALMAESSLQQLSSELSAQQSESQESSRLFHILYSGITNCTCSTTAAAETSPTALVPQPDCPIRTHDSPLPDQASVKQLLTHLQKILSAHEHQSRQLASASQQLEAYSADHAQATAVLQAAIRPPRNCSGDANQLISEGTSTPAELLELAESMAAALARHANQLTQTQTLVVHLQEQMSQAQEQKSSAMAELATCKEQLGVVAHTAHTAQMSLQQVIILFGVPLWWCILIFCKMLTPSPGNGTARNTFCMLCVCVCVRVCSTAAVLYGFGHFMSSRDLLLCVAWIHMHAGQLGCT